jgi:glycosyltransferase involved in cell wall biosynthesis
MGTLGDQKIDRFLRHLVRQNETQGVELIVVDQNDHDHVKQVLKTYKNQLKIKHLRADPGLSHARNVGLNHVTGDLVAFPDDDCWYPEGLLERVKCFFDQNPEWHGLTGRSLDADGAPSSGRWDRTSGPLRKGNVWTRAISYTIFLRRKVVSSVGEFDERLGVGAGTPWGSGEETDYLLRSLREGWKLWYDPEIVVHHPSKTQGYGVDSQKRAYAYGVGMGFVLRKNRCVNSFVYFLVRSLGGMIFGLSRFNIREVRFFYSSFLGRLKGYFRRENI